MLTKNRPQYLSEEPEHPQLAIVRHNQVKRKLQVSSAKLFDMIARGQFPSPFQIIPNGRAVGWLESDVDDWILARKRQSEEGAKC
jgi:prophage regulatory protein